MDFARKQLEKYGWTDGKGLGKNENGIAEALKPKLKRSVAGIGHDAAADFTEHWWTQLYDKAAGNVEVEEKNGRTKKIKTKDSNEFEITNSTWKIKKKRKKADKEDQYEDYFVRKAVLTNGGRKLETTGDADETDSEGEAEGNLKKDVLNMTDEELFAACGGRTAHKGARHGLKATGKLARIAQQEQMLLMQSRFDGYSHSKRRKEQENISNDLENNEIDGVPTAENKKQKKNKKNKVPEEAVSEMPMPIDIEEKSLHNVAGENKCDDSGRKIKNLGNEECDSDEVTDKSSVKKKKKKSKSEDVDCYQEDLVADVIEETEITVKKAKKKKLKRPDETN